MDAGTTVTIISFVIIFYLARHYFMGSAKCQESTSLIVVQCIVIVLMTLVLTNELQPSQFTKTS